MSNSTSSAQQEPARHDATVLFCDMRGFSTVFDERDPMEALSFANTVLSEMGIAIEASGGSIDKFTGDGILAHFGISDPGIAHAEAGVWSILRLREVLTRLNAQRHIENQPVISMGFGLHTGQVATGVIKTLRKAEFTILGGVVNTASRIESLTKYFSVDCLVSEDVYDKTNKLFEFKKMPVHELRGIRSTKPTYWLLPTNIF